MYSDFSEKKYRDSNLKESDIYNAVFKEEFFDKTGKLVDRRTIFKLGDSVW